MTDLVNVPVPAEFADEVRRFAAFLRVDRESGGGGGGGGATVAADSVPDYPLWNDEDVVALVNTGTVTSRIYRRIMDAVIARDAVGAWVSIAELAEWTGQPASVISTFRTHLYRYINAHLPAGTLAPFTRANGNDLRPARGREVYYRVGQACADQWRRVQSTLGDA